MRRFKKSIVSRKARLLKINGVGFEQNVNCKLFQISRSLRNTLGDTVGKS